MTFSENRFILYIVNELLQVKEVINMTYTSTVTKITPQYPFSEKVIVLPIDNPSEPKVPKLKKDGTPKKTKCNKKKGEKSEVYPIQIPDIKKIIGYFTENEMWQNYLIFVM